MINKKNIWFLTLFSLILVLSVYYITMPSELLLNNLNTQNTKSTAKEEEKKEPVVEVVESDVLAALRVESDELLLEELDSLKLIMTDAKSSTDEKNNAFEKMKSLNINKGEETKLEQLVETEFKLKSFIKIEDDKIKVVIDSKEHNTSLANKIMRKIQENYETKMYITVEFK